MLLGQQVLDRIDVLNDPVNWIDPNGLSNKGPNYDENWRGRPEGWRPSDKGPKPQSPMPKNYDPNGINNTPGKKMPVSPSGKFQKGGTGVINAMRFLEKLAEALNGGACPPLLILPPLPPEVLEPGFNPDNYNDSQT